MIQAVLADDEALARAKLRQLLAEERGVDVVGEAANAEETFELVRAAKPQVVFLDIHMPGMDGLDIAAELSRGKDAPPPHIIFTTAHDQYALRAFEVHAVDYLLKPFSRERLSSAIERARKQINAQQASGTSSGSSSGRYASRIVFKSRGRIVFLPLSDIRWISAEENYVRIRTATETHLLRETMARLQEKLDPEVFLRIHRSSIVNLEFVKEVRTEADGEYSVVLLSGEKVSMSRSYRARITDLLTNG
ncbi:MAG TPA: LytTR family DNA-binding domain-containing protein [Acidobacteriaceae bacterium]|nr:LytTR family DNA-binding domain-containing protein [Acidobacteriaceae bacterium]